MIIDCHNHVGADLLFYLHGDFPYAQHLVAMHDEGRALGVDRWIVFPFVSHLALDVTGFASNEIRDEKGKLHDVPYAFENRRLMREIYDLFPEEGKRMMPFAMVDPMRNTKAQAAELRKLRADYRFYGIKLQTTILQADIKHLNDAGKVFLELAAEWDLPFLIHSSITESDIWAQCGDILDIAEANPHLRFLLAHSCRYDKPSLDRVNELPNTWFDCSAHRIHCEGVVKEMPFVAQKHRRFRHRLHRPRARHRRSRRRVSHEVLLGQRLAVLQLRGGDQRSGGAADQHLQKRSRCADRERPGRGEPHRQHEHTRVFEAA